MRALIIDENQVPPGRYRRFVREAELRGMLADHLFHGEPYLALNAVVLSSDDGALLPALSQVLVSIFHKAGQEVAGDVPLLIEMGFPWAAAEILAAQPRTLPIAGRFDFVCDRSGVWWVVEFNADTPSGVREAVVADELVKRLGPAAALLRPNEGLARDIIAAFRHAVSGLPQGLALGLVTDCGELEDLAQMAFTVGLLRPPVSDIGVDVVLGDIDNLSRRRGGLSLCGRPIGSLYRYVPLETMFGTAAFADLFGATVSGSVRLLNGLYGLLLQHKGLMAWIWEHRNERLFTVEERETINAHLPATYTISRLPAKTVPSDLVFKQVFGREGEEVFFGDSLSASDLLDLDRRGTYVAQKRIETSPIGAVVQSSIGSEFVSGYVTLGSYVVDGHWAGYYTRLGQKIVTAEAKWMATFVEGVASVRHPRSESGEGA
jgi:glutathionylspermidine synthase